MDTTANPRELGGVTDALMRRILKIKALAERGVDGEQDTAQAMLANILARHNLTLDDIEHKPAREWVEVSFVGEQEHLLMDQTIRKVTQQRDFRIKRLKKTRSRYWVELSPAEHVEVEFVFALMKAAWAKEQDKLMTAFLSANKLYGPSRERADDDDDEPEISNERRAELRQIAAMSMAMNPVNVRKAIGNK
jgi:hypothetical protein